MLISVLKYNFLVTDSDCNDGRGSEYVKQNISKLFEIFHVMNVDDLALEIEKIFESIGIQKRLSFFQISHDDFDIILDEGFMFLCMKNNPRDINRE